MTTAPKVLPAKLVRVVERVRHVLVPRAPAQRIAAAAQRKVADALADGPLRIDELARRVDADPDALAGYFGHTLRSGGPMSVSGMARFVGSPEHRTHWSHLADAVRTGEAVPPQLYGMSAWDYIERTADEYRKLYEQTDFRMTRVVPIAAPISLVEGRAV